MLPRPHNRHKLRKNTATYKLRRNRRARRQVRESPVSNLSESLSRPSATASFLSLYRTCIRPTDESPGSTFLTLPPRRRGRLLRSSRLAVYFHLNYV